MVFGSHNDDQMYGDPIDSWRKKVSELEQKLAIAREALELTIDTLDHFQYSVHDSADTRFMQARLETARAALEKITKE
jgi:hypothetical protein